MRYVQLPRMSDNADKLRDILELTDCGRGQWEPLLDALVAERDALLADSIGDRLGFDERLGAAEADVARLREALTVYAGRTNDYEVARAALAEDA